MCCCCCCCKSSTAARVWAILAGIFTLLVALTYLGLSIASIELYFCHIDVTIPDFTQPIENFAIDLVGGFVYVVYYYNYQCALAVVPPEQGWKEDTALPVAERTYQWSLAYLVVSATWVVACLLMLMNGMCWCHGCSRRFFPCFWLLLTLTALVMDVVAAIQYGIDIGAIMEKKSLMALMEPVVVAGSEVQTFIDKLPVTVAVIPSVIMILAVSRIFIVWGINLFLLFTILCTCRNAPVKKKKKKKDDYAEPMHQLNQTTYNPLAIPTQASTPVQQDEFLWRGGPQQNPAYIGYDEAYDNDPGPIPQRQSYLGDFEVHENFGRRNSRSSVTTSELRNQKPWSYLQPDEPPPRPLSPLRRSASPEPDHWVSPSLLPQAVVKLPRANVTPSAPVNNYGYNGSRPTSPYAPSSNYSHQSRHEPPRNNNYGHQSRHNPYYQYPFQAQNDPKLSGKNIYLRA